MWFECYTIGRGLSRCLCRWAFYSWNSWICRRRSCGPVCMHCPDSAATNHSWNLLLRKGVKYLGSWSCFHASSTNLIAGISTSCFHCTKKFLLRWRFGAVRTQCWPLWYCQDETLGQGFAQRYIQVSSVEANALTTTLATGFVGGRVNIRARVQMTLTANLELNLHEPVNDDKRL